MLLDEKPLTTIPVELGESTGNLVPSYVFLVEGEDIANVVFESFPGKFSEKGLKELDEATGALVTKARGKETSAALADYGGRPAEGQLGPDRVRVGSMARRAVA